MDLQLGESVNQATVIDINQQVEMAQEVGFQDRVLHVRGNEGPLERPTQSQVQAEGHTPWVTIGDWLEACRQDPVEG